MNEKELQTKHIELQMASYQLKQLQSQIQEIDENLLEIETVKSNLDELKNAKKGSEILAPIASGIFLKANLQENDELAVNVGAGTVVRKNVNDTKKLLQDRITELTNVRKEMLEALEKLAEKAMKTEEELQKHKH